MIFVILNIVALDMRHSIYSYFEILKYVICEPTSSCTYMLHVILSIAILAFRSVLSYFQILPYVWHSIKSYFQILPYVVYGTVSCTYTVYVIHVIISNYCNTRHMAQYPVVF